MLFWEFLCQLVFQLQDTRRVPGSLGLRSPTDQNKEDFADKSGFPSIFRYRGVVILYVDRNDQLSPHPTLIQALILRELRDVEDQN